MIANRKKAAGLVAALLAGAPMAVARADTQTAAPAPVHFVNDDGQLMVVDPPAADWKPQMVAIPLTRAQSQASSQQNEKSASGK